MKSIIAILLLLGLSFMGIKLYHSENYQALKRPRAGINNKIQNLMDTLHYGNLVAYATGIGAEKLKYISVQQKSVRRKSEIVFSISAYDLKKGDALEVLADYQLTNDLKYDVEINSKIHLTDSSSNSDLTSFTKLIKNPERQFIISPQMHHGHFTNHGVYQMLEDCPYVYVKIGVIASNPDSRSGDSLKVNQNYGKVSVLVHKK